MAEFSSNGKGNLGVTLGAIGTGLGVLGNGLGLFGNSYTMNGQAVPQWVSKEEFTQQQTISALQSEVALLKSEQNSENKMAEVYTRLDNKFRSLEADLNTFKAEQGVINAQVVANVSVMQNQISTLNSLTKTVIPIGNVCPEPMARYNSFTTPTAST